MRVRTLFERTGAEARPVRTIGAVLEASEELKAEPGNLAVRRATLEDVFLALTGRTLRD